MACALLTGMAAGARAQNAPTAPPSAPPPAERAFAGECFEGVRFPQAVLEGPVSLRARRVHTWESGGCTRVLLEGEVRVRLGEESLAAANGVGWIEQFDDPGGPAYQVFLYLFEVGTASDAPALSQIAADELPVRAVMRPAEGVLINGDLVLNESPKPPRLTREMTNVLARAKDSFARSLRRTAGVMRPQEPVLPFRFSPAPAPPTSARWSASLPPAANLVAPPLNPTRLADYPHDTELHASQLVGLRAFAGRDGVRTPSLPSQEAGPSRSDRPAPPPRVRDGAEEAPPLTGPIFAKAGVITIGFGDRVTKISGAEEDAAVLTGGVTLIYNEIATGRTLQLTARRAVLFLNPGADISSGQFSPEALRGIYLEGEVAVTDGRFSVRAPQVYYDLAADRAIMLDAVFWTYDQERSLPFYVRADRIRQESSRQFSAQNAVLTNSGFLEPELSIGAKQVTITRERREITPPMGGLLDAPIVQDYLWARAQGITAQAAGVPFFYWPRYSGDPTQPVLRDVRLENSSSSGVALKLAWNIHNLIGLPRPPQVSAELLTDLYSERRLGLGTRVTWDGPRHKGRLYGYMLPSDSGTDLMKPGTEIVRDNEFRGVFTLEDRFRLDEKWTILTELTSISDAAYVDAFEEEAGEERREFTTRMLGARTVENRQLTLEGKGSLNDFLSNEWLLQSRGYSVTKLPEAVYIRQADDLLPRDAAGLLTWFSEYRAGRIALAFDEADASERGLTTTTLSQRALGIDPDQSPADRLRAMGLTEDDVGRLDSRHELAAKMKFGPVHVTPFVVGRTTFYDSDFAGYSSDPGGNENTRLWTATGARVSTTISSVNDTIDSRLLDIHRLRHIVEPHATFWVADTNVDSSDIPVFDEGVDRLADGTAARLGISQVFQTKRGGPGRWVNTDLLRINTDVVFSGDDSTEVSPIGRFFDARPEYSVLGDYATADLAYRLTDITSLTASTVYDFNSHQQEMATAGVLISHAPGFRTMVDLHFLNPQDSTILGLFASYDLTDKYSFSLAPSYDTTEDEVQSVWMQVRRRYSAFEAVISINYNNISGETGLGFLLRPYGTRGVGVSDTGSLYGRGGSDL